MSRNNGKHKSKKDEKWPTIKETVRQSIHNLEGIVDITETMKNFDHLQYEQAPEYTAERIVKLRKNKLNMSEPVIPACGKRQSGIDKAEVEEYLTFSIGHYREINNF